jgi:hypothetical protein
VDYIRDREAGDGVKRRYGFAFPGRKNMLIFDYQGKHRVIQQQELSEYAAAGYDGATNLVFKRTKFRGEMLVTSALLTLTEQARSKAYFLTGHGEHDPASPSEQEGYMKFAEVLDRNQVGWDRLSLVGTNGVPSDCSLLIVAGPQAPLDSSESDQVDAYLKRGGRMMALLRSQARTGLEELLGEWGVDVGDNIVIDEPNSLRGDHFQLSVTNFGAHRISHPLADSRIYMVVPRSISKSTNVVDAADAPNVETLLTTGSEGYLLDPSTHQLLQNSARGEISLGVAVEKGAIPGVSASHGATRIVVIGESSFLSNIGITGYSNYDFAGMAVNWLLDREAYVNIGAQPVQRYELTMTKSDERKALLILLVGTPGAALALGILMWLMRRR